MGFRESHKVTSKGDPRPDLAQQQGQPSGFDDRILLVFANKSRDTRRRLGQPSAMLDQKTGLPKSGQRLLPGTSPNSPRQQRLMLAALGLLLISLTFVLYRDRDFWFPDTDEAETRPLSPPDAQDTPPLAAAPAPSTATAPPAQQKTPRVHQAVRKDSQVNNDPPSPGLAVTATRTVLPPLEVEVVAGDAHRTLRPGSNAVHVDLQHAPTGQDSSPVTGDLTGSSARATTPAAGRTNIATVSAASIVTRSVQPDYPTLARQMRVQGSVILQALIGRDGLIQDLRVLSGPPILANAAEEAVRQWHFKPHYVGAQPVETRASITVNFTISTN
jgi:periplasmic protein TonB